MHYVSDLVKYLFCRMSENSGIRLLHPVWERGENHRDGAPNVANALVGREKFHAKHLPVSVRKALPGTRMDLLVFKNSSVSRSGRIPVGDGVNPGRIGDSVNPGKPA